MAGKDNLRKQRTGTVINNTSEKQSDALYFPFSCIDNLILLSEPSCRKANWVRLSMRQFANLTVSANSAKIPLVQ